MTLSYSTGKVIYCGDGQSTHWQIPFAFLQAADLHVYVLRADGTRARLSSGYQVDTTEKEVIYPLDTQEQAPLTAEEKLLILRRTPLQQDMQLEVQSTLDPQVLEDGYDKAMLIAQEQAEELSRAVKFPAGTADPTTDADAYLTRLEQATQTAAAADGQLQQSLSQAQQTVQTATEAAQGAQAAAGQLAQYAATAQAGAETATQQAQAVSVQAQLVAQQAEQVAGQAAAAQAAAQQAQTGQTQAAQSAAAAAASAAQAAQSAAGGGNMENKADKDLSNCPANYDYVVESKYPTAADPSWYRKYKSGWLEQGGLAKNDADATVTLLKPFADTNYSVQCTNRRLSTSDGWGWIFVLNMTATSFMARACYAGGDATNIRAMWEAKGFAAEEEGDA
ncbi:hypothetical protein [Candidatus Avelusimicrobium facis]|uniref:hypothetical protein n=1 Tax=Candidatus Avelusimicrobium facis TaxID=3416203 RepID=UPI003D101CA3